MFNILSAEEDIAGNMGQAVADMLHATLPDIMGIRLPLFTVFAYSQKRSHALFLGDIMDNILIKLTPDICVRVGRQQPLYGDRSRHDAVLLVDSVEALSLLYGILLKYHLNILFFYTIVLHTFRPYFYDELDAIFKLNWRVGITHANVLIHALPNSILLYNTMPYTRYHCAGKSPGLRNRFENSKWQRRGVQFFPLKLGNLYGCSLVCATWEDAPYLMEIGERNVGFRGIEGHLLDYISIRLNIKFEMRWMTDEQILRTLDDEKGVFDELFKSGTDFVVGAFRYKPTRLEDSHAPTTEYFLSDLFFVVNAKREPYNSFVKLLFPFVYEIWGLLLLMFLFGGIISMIISTRQHSARSLIIGSRNKTPIYNMFVVSLGGPISTPPQRNFARFLLLMWLTLALVMRCAYQAFMFHFIRTDIGVPPPDTIREILDQRYQLYMTKDVHDSLRDLPELSQRARILNCTPIQSFDMLRRQNEKIAILTPFEYYAYYRSQQLRDPGIHIVKEKVFTQPLSVYMRKNSPMLKRFNTAIETYSSHGLPNHFFAMYMNLNKNILSSQHDKDSAPKYMQLAQLYGALQLLVCGYVLSFFVLFIELIIHRIKK